MGEEGTANDDENIFAKAGKWIRDKINSPKNKASQTD